MEYVQMTLDDWLQMKDSLKKDLNGVAESFVRIGYKLRKIEAGKLYEQDGYKNLSDFAKAEYGLSPSTVSRFMKINEKYSIGGDSEQLRPEYKGIGSSKLSEMLTLPDADCALIRPGTTRETIRELKEFNRQEPPKEETGIREVIENFYKDNRDITNTLFGSEAYTTGDMEELVEIVNPSGNRNYKKGLYFLMMYGMDEGLKVKKFGGKIENMSWTEFFSITQEIFGEDAAGSRTYEKHFKEAGPVPEPPKPSNTEPSTKTRETEENPGKTTLAPAQNTPEKAKESTPEKEEKRPDPGYLHEAEKAETSLESEEELQIPGQMEVKDFPELMPEPENAPEEKQETQDKSAEIPKESEELTSEEIPMQQETWSRLEYIQGLTAYGTACYLVKMLPEEYLKDINMLEDWLNEKVDCLGNGEKD